MSHRIQFRRDTKSRWAEINPVLMEGEVGLEVDTQNIKMGDGSTAWNDLEYGVGYSNVTNDPGNNENLVISQKGVTELIKGTKDGMTASEYPTIKITDFSDGVTTTGTERSTEIMSNMNTWLNGVTFSTDSKLIGHCKICCDGRNGDVYNYVFSYSNKVGVQVLMGGFGIKSDGTIEYYNGYKTLYRVCNGGTWGDWSDYSTEKIVSELGVSEDLTLSQKSINELYKKSSRVGSVFGGEKAVSDGTTKRLEVTNRLEGDILYIKNCCSGNENLWWQIDGYFNGSWITIQSRFAASRNLTTTYTLPSGIEKYEKIGLRTEDSRVLNEGSSIYFITELEISDVEKVTKHEDFINNINGLPILDEDLLIESGNKVKPTTVELQGSGWWLSDYISVNSGDIYYCNASNGCFTYDKDKNDITSSSPFVSGESIVNGISFIRVKVGPSGQLTDKDKAINAASNLYFSLSNSYESYAKVFNTFLINVVDSQARNNQLIFTPHKGENLFCIGDSYTMQGQYFSTLLKVTGLNKVGDTGGDGNGQPIVNFASLIIKYKEDILKCKFVTILGGTNDYNHGSDPLGNINDCIKDEYTELKVPILKLNDDGFYVKDDSVDTTYKVLTEDEVNAGTTPKTVYAAIMTCVNIIHSWDKTINVVLCSQPERLKYGTSAANPPYLRDGKNMNTIAKAMKECHEMFGVPYYDFHANGWTIDQVSAYMNDGTLHPNSLGGEKIGRGLGFYINSL